MSALLRLLLKILSRVAFLAASEIRKAWARTSQPGVEFRGRVRMSAGCSVRVGRGGTLVVRDCHIGRGVTLTVADGARLEVGADIVGPYSTLVARERVTIGDGGKIAEMVVVRDGNHDHSVPLAEHVYTQSPIDIGEDVWLGAGVIVLAGVSIGAGSTVGAGAVVTSSLPAGCTAVGVPARPR